MAIFKNKKGENEINTGEEDQSETVDMEVEGLVPPAPDNYPSANQIQEQNMAPPSQPVEIPLNEDALKNLIKKEEENLAKKNNDITKNLDEIKKELNSLNTYFNSINKHIYEDSFFSDLKKQISK